MHIVAKPFNLYCNIVDLKWLFNNYYFESSLQPMLESHRSKYDLASNINIRIIYNLSIPIAINFSDILTQIHSSR
jgi:hypothetical protein